MWFLQSLLTSGQNDGEEGVRDLDTSGETNRDFETDEDDHEEAEKSKDSSFNISVESVSEEYGHCSQIVEEILHNVVHLSNR